MFGEILKKSWWNYLLELIIAIILINWDLKIFLIYAYLLIVFKIDVAVNFLRKLIRVFHVSNEVKLISLQRKLKVKDEETQDIIKETEDNLTEEQLTQLKKDVTDLMKGN